MVRLFNNLIHFRHHIQKTSICRSASSYSCEFCQYIGFDNLSLDRHIQLNKYCSFSNNQKKVLTGQLLDNYEAPVVSNKQHHMIISYGCKRFSVNGTNDTIQINLKDDTVERRIFFHHNVSNKQ